MEFKINTNETISLQHLHYDFPQEEILRKNTYKSVLAELLKASRPLH